jgi:hypothetical protein
MQTMFVTSDGSPRALLRRAIQAGSLPLIRVGRRRAATSDLCDALGIPIVIERHADERFVAAAVRGPGRPARETPTWGG